MKEDRIMNNRFIKILNFCSLVLMVLLIASCSDLFNPDKSNASLGLSA